MSNILTNTNREFALNCSIMFTKQIKAINMKFYLLLFAGVISSQFTFAQLKTTPLCPPIVVDVLEGNVNNELYAKSNIADVKKALPCFTEVVDKDSSSRCVGIFSHDKDIYFYTERNYIEIGEHFKGKLVPPLMGTARSSLFTLLGYPKIKDVSWDAFQTKYGILVVYYNAAGKIIKLQISSKDTDTLKLCE